MPQCELIKEVKERHKFGNFGIGKSHVRTGQGEIDMVVASKGVKREGEQEWVFGKKGRMIYIFIDLVACCSAAPN